MEPKNCIIPIGLQMAGSNTHTQTSESATLMTLNYHQAHKIKEYVHVGPNDVIITSGFGMTLVVNKLQRTIRLKKSNLLT